MDIEEIKMKRSEMLEKMRILGYGRTTINHVSYGISLILRIGESPEYDSLDDLFTKYVLTNYTKTGIANKKYAFGMIKTYLERGVLLSEIGMNSGFQATCRSSYDKMCKEFRSVVDLFRSIKCDAKLSDATMSGYCSAISKLLCHIEECYGITRLEDIREEHVLGALSAAYKDGVSREILLRITSVLCTCSHSSSNKVYAKLLFMLPELPTRKKRVYDYLKPNEEEKVLHVLCDKDSVLSYRDRAIGKLAYYTGMRRSDIANMRFENVDLEKDEIRFTQKKTGIDISLPLNVVVGNAIVDYITNERPSCNSEHIFVSCKKPNHGMTDGAVGNTAQKIFKTAGVRQEKGRNRGMHVFRHNFVSDLISKDVRREVVSRLVGHVSLDSINAYLDADIERLRDCALDISDFNESGVTIDPYKSHSKDLFNKYTEHSLSKGTWNRVVHQMLRSLDAFLLEKISKDDTLTTETINGWCKPFPGEYKEQYENRTNALCAFVDFVNETSKYHFPKPTLSTLHPDGKRTARYDKGYGSRFADILRKYEAHCEPTGRWTKKRYFVLHNFDRFCMSRDDLSAQEQIDIWSQRSSAEDLDALTNRVAVLNIFIKYANLTGTEILRTVRVDKPRNRPQKIIHAYHECSHKEISNLFYACDELRPIVGHPTSSYVCLVIPAIIRLLYSSGIRMKEARCLDVGDVDLEYGIINIRHTKGHIEHRVALHPSMKEYLLTYDRKMNLLHPDRHCFFPNEKDKYFSDTWIWNRFRDLWYKYNYAEATCYCLRHNYATTNINNWPASANVLDGRLLYLSRSMGHAKIDTTMYYYHFTHTASQMINSVKTETFNEIVPDRLSLYKRDEAE